MSVDYKSVLDKKQNIFIQKRTEQEVAVAAWYKTIFFLDCTSDCPFFQAFYSKLYQ